MSTPSYDLGPREVAEAGTEGGPAFLLSRPEWIAIQKYSADASVLPYNEDTFRTSLGAGAPADLSDFADLIRAYGAIRDHVADWTNVIFPATVDLAADIVQYGDTKAPVFYGAILREADILERDPGNERAKAALKAILDNLKADAERKADKAGSVAGKIAQFARNTQADQQTLSGADGKSGLVRYYTDKHGATSDEVFHLFRDFVDQKQILEDANKEYNHDVVIAATTVTYAWVGLPGLIAAAVVAGVYGKRATDALARARAADQEVKNLEAKLAADFKLVVALNTAEFTMNAIAREVAAALPVIQKIQGVWGGIAADLGKISRMIDDDIRDVPPIIMNLGVDEATRQWHKAALNADAYRVNAYVTQLPGQTAWLVADQFSSVRPAA
ncbi:alpha-xenorhabdolysin family binary toxin subunit A [Actinoplanes sp. NPDC049265]|uniref:alpha-xenorhabdolysin family binary toxin subunit A n=1 Tax=Actinoplanes sp. NPDC049265 TaxID=3363902 RepID=UPI00371B9168